MVWWKKPEHKNGWEDEESDELESDSRFTADKKVNGVTQGNFTKSDGKVIRVEETKTDDTVYYRQIKE